MGWDGIGWDQPGSNDMKSLHFIPPLRLRQALQNLTNLNKTARPAMHEKQRHGVRASTPFMHEMDGQRIEAIDFDGQRELWQQRIETGFVGAPGILC